MPADNLFVCTGTGADCALIMLNFLAKEWINDYNMYDVRNEYMRKHM